VLCSLLWVTLLGQGAGLGDPQRSLPTPAMLGFCEMVKALLLFGVFCLLPSVPPVMGSSVSYSLCLIEL